MSSVLSLKIGPSTAMVLPFTLPNAASIFGQGQLARIVDRQYRFDDTSGRAQFLCRLHRGRGCGRAASGWTDVSLGKQEAP